MVKLFKRTFFFCHADKLLLLNYDSIALRSWQREERIEFSEMQFNIFLTGNDSWFISLGKPSLL